MIDDLSRQDGRARSALLVAMLGPELSQDECASASKRVAAALEVEPAAVLVLLIGCYWL